MSSFRITQRTISFSVGANLQSNLTKMQKLQEELSSGKSVSKPSDSPTDAVSALRYRADIRRGNQLKRNSDDAKGWLGQADTALTSGLDLINRVRTLLQQGVNGSMDPNARAALANEVDQLREQALSLANTTYLNRPIFAGAANVTQAYDSSGNYLGDGTAVDRNVAPNVSVTVNMTGTQAFGPAGGDLFSVLSTISSDLRTNPGNLATDQTNLDSAFSRMNNALATVGARYNQVEAMASQVDSSITDSTNGLAEVESIDLPATIVQLQMQQTAYQAALSATAKVIQPSLVDFLR